MRTQNQFLLAYFKGCKDGLTHAQIAVRLKMTYNAYYQRVLYYKKKWACKLRQHRKKWPEPGRVQSVQNVMQLVENAGL